MGADVDGEDAVVAPSRATLSAVAATAGVSMPTVSKVVNGRPDVAAATRTRVRAALLEHAYSPPSARRRPVRTGTVAVFFDGLLSPYASELLSGISDAANDADVGVLVDTYPDADDPASVRAWDSWLAAPHCAGAVIVSSRLLPARIEAVREAGLALVVVDPLRPPDTEVTSVGATNFAGALAAVAHLTALGHRRIAFIGGPREAACSQARLGGYRVALESAGAATGLEPALVAHGDFGWESGLALGTALLGRAEPPTAVFAASDATALGVLEAARRLERRVPEDLSVVGFDDTYVAGWSTPPLTTVHQPLREMGAAAVRTVLRLAAGESLDSHHVELATWLVVRGSTAPPRPIVPIQASPEETP